jgi:hypothetical protein
MLSKCANPECSNSFRYLSQGTLFRWDGLAKAQHRLNLVPNTLKNPIPRIEFYWLCKDCSSHLVVVYREGIGITVRALGESKSSLMKAGGLSGKPCIYLSARSNEF